MCKFSRLAVTVFLVAVIPVALIANGLNLNSNGAKAVSMGGAFVALADDYSAIFWNPAGLTQMKEPSLSLYIGDIVPMGKYKLSLAGIDTKSEINHYISGAFGFFKPLSDRVTVGLYAYIPCGLGIEWKGEELKALTSGKAYEWKTLFGMVTLSPAVAVKITDKFSLGGALNINYALEKMKRPGVGQYEEDINGMAVGATISMLYKPSAKFSLGMTFKTPIDADLSGKIKMPGAALAGLPTEVDGERKCTWPMWIAAGICFKPTEKLTFTADLQYTDWKKLITIPNNFDNAGWQALFGQMATFELKWKSVVQVRFGMEYKVSDKLALRGGYYYDPSPGPVSTHNLLLPEFSYNWITCGFGWHTGKLSMDMGFEYAFGKDVLVTTQNVDPRAGMLGLHSMTMFVPTIAFTYHF